MKAVILDGYTLNPGDLSWDGLKAICDLTVYDRTPSDKIIERIKDAEIVITNKTPITKEILAQARQIKYIGVLATGYNVVDVQYAKELGIPVTNVPSYSTNAVAQLTFAMILEICHHVASHSEAVKNGQWSSSEDFCFWIHPLIELEGKTLGIIGFGNIGQRVSQLAQSFGMNVLVYNRTVKNEFESNQLRFVSIEELYQLSDIISLHIPLSVHTKEMINKNSIEKMKDGVILINTSRGGLINENDVYEALVSGKLSAAAVDVVSQEPIQKDNPLLKAKNIFITPHIAWAPFEARQRLLNIAESNVKAFLNHEKQNVVNLE